MKRLLTITAFAAAALGLCAQDYYKVEIKTFIGGRLDDTCGFVMAAGKTERKGFEGRLLSKNYNANGFEHYLVTEIEALHAKLKAEADAEEQAKANTKRPAAEVIIEELEKKVSELRNAYNALDKRTQSGQQRLEFMNERIEMLEKIIAAGKKTPSKLKEYVKKYEDEYEPKKDDDARPYQGKRNDYTEFDVGSFADFTLVSADAKGAVFSVTYAYSALIQWIYTDGNNNGNSITKFPLFESYFSMDVENAKVPLGAEYCIQFGRKKPNEAQNLQSALQNSALFGHKSVPAAPQPANGTPTPVHHSATAAELAEISKIFEENKTELDKHGLLSEIQKEDANPSQTVRAVIKITPFKL